MSNTTPEAAQAGWLIYRRFPTHPSRNEINEQLAAQGLPPVADRMYRHYEALTRHGRTEYVPVNELDVAIKAERLGRSA